MAYRCVLIVILTIGRVLTFETIAAQKRPEFDVASVVENRSGGMTRLSPGLQPSFPGGPVSPAPGQISINNATLREIIVLAYGINHAIAAHVLKGGPDRILERRFNIAAVPPRDAPASETLAMLRTLLADRFQLRTRVEEREVPVYALIRAEREKLGPNLRPSSADCTSSSMPRNVLERARVGPKDARGQPMCPSVLYEFGNPGPDSVTIRYVSPLSFLISLTQAFVDRPIVDESDLRGSFEWRVSFSPSLSLSPRSESSGLTVFAAFHQQLGLKLESRSSPMRVTVIDDVQMPSPN